METRALLAFALSMIIITLWIAVFSPSKAPSPEKGRRTAGERELVESGQVPAKGAKPKAASIEEIAGLAEQKGTGVSTEKIITVETPLYEAKVSSRGGGLLSWKLRHYMESAQPGSPPIDLVSHAKTDGAFPLALRVNDRLDALINSTFLDFDRGDILLTEQQETARLRGTASLPSGFKIVKEMVFYGDRYIMDLVVTICDEQGRPISDRLGILWPYVRGHKSSRWSGYAGPVAFSNNKFSELKDLKKLKPADMNVQWAGVAQKYFLTAIIPLDDGIKSLTFDEQEDSGSMVVVEDSDGASPSHFKYQLYLGPKTIKDLKHAKHDLDKSMSFGMFGIISKPLLTLLIAINKYTHNYGIAIIVLTIIIKLLFWPLTHKSYASMKEMQKVQPRIKQLRERFKNDKEQLNREMMLLYKTHKVNPMGGCFPMLLQFPVFIALYKALLDSIEIRHAPFILWVKDLAAPDYLLRFPSGVSFFGIEGIGPLPLLMGVSMLIQQRMTPSVGDPTQQKVMMLMPIFFTFLFISFPSGLVLYWLINNVLSIVQQVYIYSRLE